MKKYFFIIFSLVIFASCENTNEIPENEILVTEPVSFNQKSLPCFGEFDNADCTQSGACCTAEIIISPAAYADLVTALNDLQDQSDYFTLYRSRYQSAIDADLLDGLIDMTHSMNLESSFSNKRFYSIYEISTNDIEKVVNFTVKN